jgi:PhoH-like ATPase
MCQQHQNLALELMTDDTIPVVSVQSEAGYGKSFLALASALYLLLGKKSPRSLCPPGPQRR